MAEIGYATEIRPAFSRSTDWSAIWAGLFTFISIWSVFSVFGLALFSGASNAANPGLGIWSITLAAVAMYIAGFATGRMAFTDGRIGGIRHGMVMFGLSVTTAAILTMGGASLLAGMTGAGAFSHARILNFTGLFDGSQWMTFLGLFVGWLGAMLGAGAGSSPRVERAAAVASMRPAA